MCDETLLNQFLDSGHIQENALAAAIAKEAVFPCYFGSALKLEGVSEFLDGLERGPPRCRTTPNPSAPRCSRSPTMNRAPA